VNQHDRSNAIPHELLLDQAGFLRRLARDLVRDPHAAEDAVQDVWVAALEHPPRHEGNLHGWLAAVLKNLISKRSRARARRTHHEQEAARSSPRHDAAVPAESEATVRFVTESVLALDEPYRSAILLRYFEELSVREIAERQCVPVTTMKSRLQRALEILRERMERRERNDGRSWQMSLLALARPDRPLHWIPHAAPLAKAGTGVLLMTLKTKFALGCAAALVAWLLFHQLTSMPDRVPSEPLANSSAAAPLSKPSDASAPAKPALEADAKPAERLAGGSAPTATTAANANERSNTLFYGSLLDSDGKPIIGAWSAWVGLTDLNGRRRNCDAKEGGSFAFSRIPYGKYWLSAGAFGFKITPDTIELDPEHARLERDITLQRQPLLRIRATTPDGKNLAEVLGIDRFGGPGIKLVPVATRERPGPMFNEVVGSLNNTFGIGHFWQYGPLAEKLPAGCMGLVLLDEGPPAYMSLLNWHAVLQTKEVHPGDEEVDFVLRPEDVRASMATIRVQVFDADGTTPLAGAGVALMDQGEDEASGGTGPDGIANIEKVVPCEGELVIRAKDHATQSVHIVARAGVVTDAGHITLDNGLTLNAMVLDPAGAPVSARLYVIPIDSSTGQPRTETEYGSSSAGDGQLSIPHLGREVYVLRTMNLDASNDQEHDTVKLVSGNVRVDLRSGVAPNALQIRLTPASSLSLVVPGEPADRMRFRIIDSQDLALVSGRFWGDAPYPFSLPPGAYRVEFLDRDGKLLSTRSVTLGTAPLTLELSR
jgi:RNA polymerase sigma-70 factor (ECF subfamily)